MTERQTTMDGESILIVLMMNNLTQCLTCTHYCGINTWNGEIECYLHNHQATIGRLATDCKFREEAHVSNTTLSTPLDILR